MSSHFSMKDARNHFSQIINSVAESGQEIIVTKSRKPLVKIVPIYTTKIKLGLLKGKKYFMSEDFDSELEKLNKLFYESED